MKHLLPVILFLLLVQPLAWGENWVLLRQDEAGNIISLDWNSIRKNGHKKSYVVQVLYKQPREKD